MTRLVQGLLLAFVAATATVLACEAALRALDFSRRLPSGLTAEWPWLTYSPLTWRANRAGFAGDDFRINALGFRGPETTRAKPAGLHRIVCLGDSSTFGLWQEEGGLIRTAGGYPEALRRRLAQRGHGDVEVVNAGVLGFTSAHAVRQLLTTLLPLTPDVVTVRVGSNDHATARGREASFLASDWGLRVFRRLPTRLFDWELVRVGLHLAWHRLPDTPPDWHRVPRPRFRRDLRLLVETARTHGARVLLLDYPYRPIERGPSPGTTFPNFFSPAASFEELHRVHRDYQAIVAAVAAETGTPLLETAAALARANVPVFTDHDLSHPTAAGADIIATLLADRLGALGWLPPAP